MSVIRGVARSGSIHHVLMTAGVSGEIPYCTGTHTLEHSSSLKWDAVNGRLGIGGAPADTLDVYGNAIIGASGAGAIGSIELGKHGTGNRFAYIDLIGDDTYTDYGLRLIRNNAGPNTTSQLVSRGTGGLYLAVSEAGPVVLQNPSGQLKINTSGNVEISNDLVIGSTSPTAALDINSDKFRLRSSKTPASAADTGDAGNICWDSDYIYVCVAANTWKRAAIATW